MENCVILNAIPLFTDIIVQFLFSLIIFDQIDNDDDYIWLTYVIK